LLETSRAHPLDPDPPSDLSRDLSGDPGCCAMPSCPPEGAPRADRDRRKHLGTQKEPDGHRGGRWKDGGRGAQPQWTGLLLRAGQGTTKHWWIWWTTWSWAASPMPLDLAVPPGHGPKPGPTPPPWAGSAWTGNARSLHCCGKRH